MKLGVVTFAVILASSAPGAQAAGDPAAGKQKSATCSACHGPDGNSVNPVWPKIAGQHAEYARKQLLDFQSGRRENAQMTPMATPLSAQDIDDLSTYFSTQVIKPGTTAPEHMDLGQRLYRAGSARDGLPACMACHGPNGIGNPAAGYPAVQGQYAEYTAAQLKAFKAEQRANDANSIMRDIAAKMGIAEIEAVSGYIQGLR
ncbi:MAG: cytochrome c4 [Gammaproteobacteria bacterium]|nr:cytochrome c4 [Gammaproteobacteria bacterium]